MRPTMTNPKDIVLDADGVLLNFIDGFEKSASQILGRSIQSSALVYELGKRFGLTPEEEDAVWDYMYREGLEKLHPLPGAVEAFQQLKSWGYRVHIVTGILEKGKLLRLENLKRLGMIPDSVHCVDHGRARKDPIVRKIRPIVFVDDRLEHLKGASFVPNLVWVDDGIDQHGHTSDHTHMRVTSFKDWVDHWGAKMHAPVRSPTKGKSL